MSKIKKLKPIKIYQNSREIFSEKAIATILGYTKGSQSSHFLGGNLDVKTNTIDSARYFGEGFSPSSINLDRLNFLIVSSQTGKSDSLHEEILTFLLDKPTGFIAIDLDCQKALILKPYTQAVKKTVSQEEVLSYFKKNGHISKMKEDYEERETQMLMVKDSVHALNHDAFYLCEAPTGTGKSISYLMSAIIYTQNNQEKLVISTNTIALQEQLFLKDLPFVKKLLPFDLSYAMVKGKNNFLCKQRFDLFKMSAPLIENRDSFKLLDEWEKISPDGDRSNLETPVSNEIWGEINVDGSLCRPSKCPYKEECFYLKQKEKVSSSHVLVANHHILCADANIKDESDSENIQSILPFYETLVIDEAHNLEEVASSYFSSSTSNIALNRLMNQIIRFEGEKIIGGLLREFHDMEEASFIHPSIKRLVEEIHQFNQHSHIYESIYLFLERISQNKQKDKNIRIKERYFEEDVWKEQCFSKLEALTERLEKIIKILDQIKDLLENKGFKNTADYSMHRLEVYIFRLSQHKEAFSIFFDQNLEDSHVKAIKINSFNRQFFIAIETTPLDISLILFEKLFSKIKRALVTSATLSDNNGFNFFKDKVGLSNIENVMERKLPSAFNFKDNVDFFIPEDIAEPNHQNYLDDLSRYICSLAVLANGKTLVLFTSLAQLHMVYGLIAPVLASRGIEVLKQGETPKHLLLKDFTKKTSVLLGVNSFWEGIDLKGDLLKVLIITKLPFSVPSDPFYEAKTELLQKQGKNPFTTYSIPEAVIRFKQGFGRLIRSSSDTGVFCVLDKRVDTKFYGEVFIKSLPEMRRIRRLDEIKHL